MFDERLINHDNDNENHVDIPADYEEARELWKVGEISSDDFLDIALKRLSTSEHLFRNGATMIRDISRDEFDTELQRSPDLAESRRLGEEGEDPSEYYKRNFDWYFRNFRGHKTVKNRYLYQDTIPGYEVQLKEFALLDPRLPQSLPLHFYVASRSEGLYEQRKEGIIFSGIRNAVFQNVPDSDEAAKLHLWISYHGLLSAIKRYKVQSILRITDAPNYKFAFADYENVAVALGPYAYFRGWEERLRKANDSRDFTLPEPFRSDAIARQALLTAAFAYEDKGTKKADLLARALTSIQETGKTEKILDVYARKQAKAIATRSTHPFKVWEEKRLGIYDLVNKYIAEKNPDAVRKEKVIQKTEEVSEAVTPNAQLEPALPETLEENLVQEQAQGTQSENLQPEDTEGRPLTEPVPDKPKASSTRKSRIEDLYRRKKTEIYLGKEYWSSIEYDIYLRALLEGNEALLESTRYPSVINPDETWNQVMQDLREGLHNNFSRSFYGVSEGIEKPGFSQLLTRFPDEMRGRSFHEKRDFILDSQGMNPVIADLIYEINVPELRQQEIVSLDTIYNFLTDPRRIPILGVSMYDNNYFLFRSKETVNITEESNRIGKEEFERIWYENAGLTVARTEFQKLFSQHGLTFKSSFRDRSPASRLACESHDVAMYRSRAKEKEPFIRIA